MKSSGSSGIVKGSSSGNIAYGQPYIAGGAGDGQVHRVGTNTNLKSYINELKKATNANKSVGKRGQSSSRQGPAAVGTQNGARNAQQSVVQTYGIP